MKAQINEFGQTPKQIFKQPHVQKRSKMGIKKELGVGKVKEKEEDKEEEPKKVEKEEKFLM